MLVKIKLKTDMKKYIGTTNSNVIYFKIGNKRQKVDPRVCYLINEQTIAIGVFLDKKAVEWPKKVEIQ